jgi:FlaG/FlaF family flagellin (archaellin)
MSERRRRVSEWRSRASERGVSDVIGFVLVFALITSTVAIVYTFGFTGLENAREEEQLSNAERVFDILADNVADLQQRGAPSRATELKLSDATLGYGSETSLTVEVTNMPSPAPTYSTNLDPIVYAPTDSSVRLVYENGAVFRERQGRGGVVLERPESVFRKDGTTKTVVIPFVQTRQTGKPGVGGSSTVRIRTENTGSEVMGTLVTPTDADSDPDGDGNDEYAITYTVDTTPTRAPLWEASIEERISWKSDACSVSDGTVTCTFGVERLYVTATRVDVSFS